MILNEKHEVIVIEDRDVSVEIDGDKVAIKMKDRDGSERVIERDLGNYEMLWSLTEQANWPENYRKVDSLKSGLFSSLNKEQAGRLRTEMDDVEAMLYHTITRNNTFSGLYGGEDSFSDMLCEIVSHGKDFVKKALLTDPEAAKTLREKGIHESFSYIVPYQFDYVQEYQYKGDVVAKEEISNINRKLDWMKENLSGILSSDYIDDISKEAKKIVPYLEAIVNDDSKKFEGKENDLKNYFKKFSEKAKYANKALEMSSDENMPEILSVQTENIISNYIKQKKTVDFKFDFSEFKPESKNKSKVKPK
jgi:hypothetical protein